MSSILKDQYTAPQVGDSFKGGKKEHSASRRSLIEAKLHTKWLKSGDDNPKYFHTATLIRRRRNKVEALINDEGVWTEDREQLKNMEMDYYSKLFSSEATAVEGFPSGFFPSISDNIQNLLKMEVSPSETKRALMQMGSWKAPRPDGIRPVFTRGVGTSCVDLCLVLSVLSLWVLKSRPKLLKACWY